MEFTMEDDLRNKTLELRRAIEQVIKKFWIENKGLSMEEVFFINSIVISSLIAQIVYALFRKDIGTDPQCSYIDELCNYAKHQLREGKELADFDFSFDIH